MEKNVSLAIEYYRQGVEMNQANCCYNLALIYKYGKSVPEDTPRAIELYQKAATLKHVSSMYNLGELNFPCFPKESRLTFSAAILYESGDGVEKNLDKAVELYEECVRLGHPTSM